MVSTGKCLTAVLEAKAAGIMALEVKMENHFTVQNVLALAISELMN
jgi:hypothetical protein